MIRRTFAAFSAIIQQWYTAATAIRRPERFMRGGRPPRSSRD
jgi:hypothetical protein